MSVIRICTSCRSGKHEEDFRPDNRCGRLRRDCRDCENHDRNARRTKEATIAYNRSISGTARNLRHDHGYGRADSLVLAARLLDDFETCDLCGIVNYVIKKMHARGYKPKRGTQRNNTRLHPDHIDGNRTNSTLANTRLLCPTCNLFRREALFADTDVWIVAREWYEFVLTRRMTWWLHRDAPGQGGRRFRSERMQRKFEDFAGRVIPMTGPLPTLLTYNQAA